MSLPLVNPEPIDRLEIEAASGSALTSGRMGMSRWTPKWGGKSSRPDVIPLGLIALVFLVVVALLVL